MTEPRADKIPIALVQLCAGRDPVANVRTAVEFIREATSGGARYVQTPEVTTLLEPDRERLFANIRPEAEETAVARFADLARDHGIWLHVGSVAIRIAEDKAANRAFLFDPSGHIAARYDKIHMFDVTLPGGETYRESRNFAPGHKVPVIPTVVGRLGITICYDVRFPALYRALAKAGAEVLAIPAAFTVPTGEAHWHTLLRARAIETGSWVLAAAQAGNHESGRKTYGHSLVVSPWGEVVAEGDGVQPAVIRAEVDLAAVAEARRRIPSLEHDRPFEVTPIREGGET